MSPRFFVASLFLGIICPVITASPLKSDEHVLFIPDIAYETTSNEIIVSVQAWIYEKERRLGMTTALMRYLGINKDQLSNEEYQRLYERTQLFRVDSERNKNINVKFADQNVYSLPATKKDGRTQLLIRFKSPIIIDKQTHTISYQLDQSSSPATANKGLAIFAPQTGISVISDIDDTIKDSNVLDKKQLLINTFTQKFKVITRMRDWYQTLAKTNKGNVAFHYVSSSPIQLYPALKSFMDEAQFPLGSFHLREGTTWHSVVATGNDSKQHKKTNIERLLAAYPNRHFILVGDSGEADPEIYADIMRQYPNQVSCIAIRNVTNEDSHSPRYQQTFKNINTDKWRIFSDAATLKDWCHMTTQ